MHLLYIWINNYKGIKEQGIKLSSKYDISVEKKTTEERSNHPAYTVTVESNKDFIADFFGPKVFDITAAVGQNGAGKTTLAHIVMECAPEGIRVSRLAGNEQSFFLIYEGEEKNGIGDIYIVTNNIDVVSQQQNVRLKSYDSSIRFQPMVYLSNVFNPSEMKDSFTTGDLAINDLAQQRSYTPALIMKRHLENRRKAYHYYPDTGYSLALYTPADLQMQNIIQGYADYQAISFLNCYFHAPDSVKNELSVFDQITIKFRSFAEELTIDPKERPDFEKWSNSPMQNPGDISEKENPASDNLHFPNRYVLEYCKRHGYQRFINKENADWKDHILACLLSEVMVLLFGPLLDKVYVHILKAAVIANIAIPQFWDSLKNQLEEESQSDNCCVDSGHMKYAMTIFNKFYKEAKEIIAWNEHDDVTEGVRQLNEVENFLKFYKQSYMNYCTWTKYISLELHPSSSGELAMVNLMSYVYQAFADQRGCTEDMLIIIDELDAYMHPRWQQKIVNWLLKWWNDSELFAQSKVQLFFTTHSPILLSDIPSDRITRLFRTQLGICLSATKYKTFGADIYTLFYDSFFMNKGSIGEFAKHKVNELIHWLKEDTSGISEKEALYLLDTIGDQNAAGQLKQMYEEKKHASPEAKAFQNKLRHLSEEEQKVLEEYIQNMEK